ncbi:MAG: hypothetical protein ABIH23_30320 [bacterium]
MRKTTYFLLFIAFPVVCVWLASAVYGEEAPDRSAASNTHMLVVGGVHKDSEEMSAQDELLAQLLDTLAVTSMRSFHLLAPPDSSLPNVSNQSTRENIKTTIDALTSSVRPSDSFVFYYLGQANIVDEQLRFNLRGPDITHGELASWIGGIHSATTVVILDCPGAGRAIERLAGPGRIIICSARSDQPYTTHFSEFFITALANVESDANRDGRISLLEAFQSASQKVDQLYRDEELLRSENSLLEDDGDGVPSQQPWRYREDAVDGKVAAHCFLWQAEVELHGRP